MSILGDDSDRLSLFCRKNDDLINQATAKILLQVNKRLLGFWWPLTRLD